LTCRSKEPCPRNVPLEYTFSPGFSHKKRDLDVGFNSPLFRDCSLCVCGPIPMQTYNGAPWCGGFLDAAEGREDAPSYRLPADDRADPGVRQSRRSINK
jgi:hypothetical protein